MFNISWELIAKIVGYIAIGIAPIIYNYYFVKDRIDKLRKAYLTRLKKYLPLLNAGSNLQNKVVKPSRLTTTFESLSNTSTPTLTVNVGESQGKLQPFIVVTQTVSHNLNAIDTSRDQVNPTPVPYVVFIVDMNTLRNSEELAQIISSVTSNLPTLTLRVEQGNEN